MILFYLISKEFKQFLRNRILPAVCLVLPLALMNIVPRIATQEVRGLRFTVVDNDHSTLSRRLIQRIDASAYLDLVKVSDTYPEAMESVMDGSSDLILELEPHMERHLLTAGSADVMISANATNAVKGAMAQSYVAGIIQSEVPVQGSPARFRFLFNSRLDYRIYMVPAVFGLMLILVVGFLPALNIVGEKERGTIEQVNVTPVGKVAFILSKVIPYVAIGMVMVAEGILTAWLTYGILPSGNLFAQEGQGLGAVWGLYAVTTVFSALVSSLGLIVSNYARTIRQAALTMFFFLVIFILMSGLITPVTSMPVWAQRLNLMNPMRYLIEALRAIYVKGATLSQVSSPLTRLTVMALAAWTWAIWSYKKNG